MKNDILRAISANSIFGTDEVHRVFEIFKSYDIIVAGCEFARKMGIASLETACILRLSSSAKSNYCECEGSNYFVCDRGMICWSCHKPHR